MTTSTVRRNEIKEARGLLSCGMVKVKSTDVTKGTKQRFPGTARQGVRMFPEESRQAENKRKLDNNHQAQQQLPKRQNVVQAYAAGTGERKEYAGTLPLVSDCPKLKNRNHGNQAEGTGTHGMVLALGGGETDQDPNNIEDEIEA
ncbi:hypothetical protein Tco_0445912 [Tanacetum coccineum]